MGLINWIFDLYQHSRIEDLHRQAESARAEAFALRNTGGASGAAGSAALERAIGELALAVKTVQRLAVQKGLCTAAEFQQTMEQIDREDGRADGMTRWR
ncbi:MAG: hypothetical protein JNL90_16180 [Planctomycetes bacterium]|nr:hypothetical protein [Planctomycetota bacterium]